MRRVQRWFEGNPIFTPQFTTASTYPFSKTVVSIAPAHEKLRHEHVLAPQCDGTIDLMILMVLLRSTTPIYLPFLPSFLHPRVILSLNDQVTCGPPNSTDEIDFAFRASGVSILKLLFLRGASTQSSRSIDTWSSRIER
jgi:hypothetical protein